MLLTVIVLNDARAVALGLYVNQYFHLCYVLHALLLSLMIKIQIIFD